MFSLVALAVVKDAARSVEEAFAPGPGVGTGRVGDGGFAWGSWGVGPDSVDV